MKNLLLVFAMLLSQSYAQNAIYKTYEDYKNGNAEPFDEYVTSVGFTKVVLKFKSASSIISLKCDEFWGFTYKGKLFRNIEKWSMPVMLVSSDKIHYYENGLTHLKMLRDGTKEATAPDGTYCYLSENLETEIIDLPLGPATMPQKLSSFKDKHPDYESLFKCINNIYTLERVRECVEKFQTGK